MLIPFDLVVVLIDQREERARQLHVQIEEIDEESNAEEGTRDDYDDA